MWGWVREQLPRECSTVMVTSALPEGVEAQIREELPDLVARVGRGLHRTRHGVDLELVDCSEALRTGDGGASIFGAKMEELRDVLAASRHALVLCNNAVTCERVERALLHDPWACGPTACPMRDETPTIVTFHDSLTAKPRGAALTAFRRATANSWEETSPGGAPPPRVLIATGRAVRGLDLAAASRPIDQVVLFDFAPDAKSYLARVGCATRGPHSPAPVSALAVGSQLPFAKALLAHDGMGSEHELRADTDPQVASRSPVKSGLRAR